MNNIVKLTVADAFKHLRPTRSLGDGISSGFTWIAYHNQKWSLRYEGDNKMFVDEKGNISPNLDVVIIDCNPNISKMFYHPGTYQEGSASAPVCASLNGDKPDPGVPEPQHPVCADCPNNAWGSGQGRGKACQDHRKVAVLILPYMTKRILDKPLTEPVYLKVNPNSLKSLKAYGDKLQHAGMHWATVITRIIWDPKRPWVMNFSVLQALKNEDAEVILPLLESATTKSIIGSRVEVYEEEQAPPSPPEHKPVVETGLVGAFGGKQEIIPPKKLAPQAEQVIPLKRGPGRPRKAAPEQEPMQQTLSLQAEEQTTEETGNSGDATPPWDKKDPELDSTIAKLTENKMKGMLR